MYFVTSLVAWPLIQVSVAFTQLKGAQVNQDNVGLAQAALELYESVAKRKEMEGDTWDLVIRVVLGICDFMMEGEEVEHSVGTKVRACES